MIAFAQGDKIDGLQFMTLQKLSGLTEQVEYCSSVHSLDVIGRLPFVAKEKSLHFRRETSVVKFLKHSLTSVSIQHMLLILICKF